MFENVVSPKAIELIEGIFDEISGFYLAGGTGLALQIGHRISQDLDFFSAEAFDAVRIKELISPEKIGLLREKSLHCVKEGVRLPFLFYDIPLCYPTHMWRGIRIASWQDIVAEKLKAISQRGSKKDFYDLYATIVLKSNIEEAGSFFMKRFKNTGINLYHVLKSIVYFEDADKEPDPILLEKGKKWEWKSVKRFFEVHLKNFESVLIK